MHLSRQGTDALYRCYPERAVYKILAAFITGSEARKRNEKKWGWIKKNISFTAENLASLYERGYSSVQLQIEGGAAPDFHIRELIDC